MTKIRRLEFRLPRYWCSCVDYQKLGVCLHSKAIRIHRQELIFRDGDDHRPIKSTNPNATATRARPGGAWDTEKAKAPKKKKKKKYATSGFKYTK